MRLTASRLNKKLIVFKLRRCQPTLPCSENMIDETDITLDPREVSAMRLIVAAMSEDRLSIKQWCDLLMLALRAEGPIISNDAEPTGMDERRNVNEAIALADRRPA